MNEIDAFYQDKETCTVPSTHVIDGTDSSPLLEIDELFGAADVLSICNAEKRRRVLLALSVAGTLLTLAFLLYDEAEIHGLILACGAMILCLFFVRHISERMDCHRKYLEYRVLAECLRCQYFLTYAGATASVLDILPWSVRKGIPWITEILKGIPAAEDAEKHSVLSCWINDQKKYHEKALRKTEIEDRRNGLAAKAVLIVTIVTYVAALVFELAVYGKGGATADQDVMRIILKIMLGTMSAVTLFTGNYYGKMSLSNVIDDHKRMISLYETAEEEIAKYGESEELLLSLAREFLNENSTWYSYQSKNKPEIIM